MTDSSDRGEAAAASTALAGRLSTTAERVMVFVRRTPASATLAVIVLLTAAATGTMFGTASAHTQSTWAVGVATTVDAGRWWTVLTSLVIPWDPFQLVASVAAALLLLGIAERVLGTWRTVVAFVSTGILAIAVGLGLFVSGAMLGDWWAIEAIDDLTLDPLTGIIGALMASTALMAGLWRRRVRLTVTALVVVWALYDGDSSNVFRLIALGLGVLLGAWFARDASTLRSRRSSHRETRRLISMVVAVTAIGPLVALINAERFTPFSLSSFLFSEGIPNRETILAKCDGVETAACTRELALLSAEGPGMFLLVFLPLVLLLLAAWGMRNGRRFGMLLAVVVNLALALLAWFSLDVAEVVATTSPDWGGFDGFELTLWGLATVLVPLAVAALVLVFRRWFTIRAPRAAFRRFVIISVGSFAVLFATYFVTAALTIDEFVPQANAGDLLLDSLKRFIPVQFIASVDPIVVPEHDAVFVLYQLVGPLFWAIFVVAALPMIASVADRAQAGDRARVLRLLERGGGGSLGYMSTWPGNSYWFSDDEQAAVAYRVISGVALTTSDPICRPGDEAATIRGFVAFCDVNNWTPTFYSVHDELTPIFDELGWQRMSVGEETVVPTVDFSLTGKAWQKVRQPLNRGLKEGLTTLWTTWAELPLATAAEITAISEAWVSEKELPEMGFTLGGMEELKDPEVALMLAIGPDERIQAVTSWLPTFRDGVPIGWTIDFMRRADESMPGVMEFVIASAALHMSEQHAEFLSLSGAPLAQKPVPKGEEAPPVEGIDRLLEWLGTTLEPAYGFSSLFRFKAKFNPEYRTIWMAYPDPLALPAIGIAVSRAYLPDVSPAQAIALVRTLKR